MYTGKIASLGSVQPWKWNPIYNVWESITKLVHCFVHSGVQCKLALTLLQVDKILFVKYLFSISADDLQALNCSAYWLWEQLIIIMQQILWWLGNIYCIHQYFLGASICNCTCLLIQPDNDKYDYIVVICHICQSVTQVFCCMFNS